MKAILAILIILAVSYAEETKPRERTIPDDMLFLAHCKVEIGAYASIMVNGSMGLLWIDNLRMMYSTNASAIFIHATNLWSNDPEKEKIPAHESVRIIKPSEVKLEIAIKNFKTLISGEWINSKGPLKDTFDYSVPCKSIDLEVYNKFNVKN